jgi:peptide/nickel transport system substrate-binding protein
MKSTKSLKNLRPLLAGTLCLLLLLAGCGGKPPAAKRIVIGENADLGGYDPGTTMSPFVRMLVFNSLVEQDADFKLAPALAERWEMSADGKVWTLHLRKGVKFHDGTPFNAEAARHNLERLRKGSGRVWLADIQSIETLDDSTLKVRMSKPLFTFASDLAVPFFSMVSPAAVAADGKVQKAIGTGPFILDSWQKDQEFVMKKNANYWGGAPKPDSLVFKVIRDPDTRAMALESGSVDLISLRQTLTAANRLKNNPKLKIAKRLGQTSEILFFNVDRPGLQDVRVRRALAQGMNIRGMVPGLLGDNAEAGRLFFSPAYGDFVLPQEIVPQHDPAVAKKLLTEAEIAQPLSLRLVFGAKNAEDSLLANAIQNDLKAIGVTITLVPLEEAALMDSLKKRNFDLIMLGQSFIPHNEPSSHYRRGYYHPQATYPIFHTAALTAQIERLSGTAAAVERLKLHHEIQRTIAEAMPFVVLFHRNNLLAMKKELQGVDASVGTWQIYRGLTQAHVQP